MTAKKNPLLDRFLKATKIKEADIMTQSVIYNEKDVIPTPVPAINIAYSGSPTGGFVSGVTIWAGPSKHFKTMFALISAASYMKKYPESICIFYDNEFGSPISYFTSVGIDPERVIHIPFMTVEELRTDIVNMLNETKRGDKVIYVVDSLGMAASAKEVKDAEDGSEKADMTRAKVFKSLFRIITPHFRTKDVPLQVIMHTYDTMELYAKKVVSGGTGAYYAADNIYIIGRQQDKDGKEIAGWKFIINVEKSRYIHEKAKIPIEIKNGRGINTWSGMLDIAVEGGYINRPNNRTYLVTDPDTGEVLIDKKYTLKEIENNTEAFTTLFKKTNFAAYIEDLYKLKHGSIFDLEEEDEPFEEEDDEEVDFNIPASVEDREAGAVGMFSASEPESDDLTSMTWGGSKE